MKRFSASHCDGYLDAERRRFLRNGLYATAGAAVWQTGSAGAVVRPTVAGPAGDALVCIFLRGAADVLNAVPPIGDPGYARYRPTIAVAAPDDTGTPVEARAIDLGDGLFGLHPALAALVPLFQDGRLLLLPGAGSPDESRSHFKAQDLMEGGFAGDNTGWLGRHLVGYDTANPSTLRGTGMGYVLPMALATPIESDLRGLVVPSIDGYRLYSPHPEPYQGLLGQWYADTGGALARIASQTLDTADALAALPPPVDGIYPDTPLGRALRDVARIVRGDLGLEVACVDSGGWDTHHQQGLGGDPAGALSLLLRDLGDSLGAFVADLGDTYMDRITIVVMSEFGRQFEENSSLGSDHGRGGLMMALGNHVVGGRVFVNQGWQPIDDLAGRGAIDLDILTDYRDVLGEIVRLRLNNSGLDAVFPGYAVTEHGLVV